MSDRTFQVILTLGSVIFAAVISPLVTNAINKLSNERKEHNNEEKLNYKKIKIDIEERHEHFNYSRNEDKSKNSDASDEETWGLFIAALLLGIGAVYSYLKFKATVHFSMQLLIIFISSLVFITTYMLYKNKIEFDSSFKWRYTSSILGLIVAQLNLYLLDNPLYYQMIDKDVVLKEMQEQGLISLLTDHSAYVFGFLIYQVLGIILTIFIFFLVVVGITNIIALVNIAISEKEKNIWNSIFKFTYKFAGKPLPYFVWIIFISLTSLALTSGIVIQFLESLNNV